ncbi:hypothetical protein LCGC14_2011960, partial [marine sediment metagenome]
MVLLVDVALGDLHPLRRRLFRPPGHDSRLPTVVPGLEMTATGHLVTHLG